MGGATTDVRPATPADVAKPPDAPAAPRSSATARRLLAAGGALAALVVPAVWLVGAWWVGPKLNHQGLPFLTPVLFGVVLIGLPASLLALFRWLFRVEARLAAQSGEAAILRVRRTRATKPAPVVLEPEPLPDLGVGRRVAAAALVLLMFAGTIAVWLGAPLWSIWAASQIADSQRPQMWAYVLVLVGIALSMVVGIRALALLHRAYRRVTGVTETARRQPAGWLKSYTDDRAIRGTERGLEAAMVAAVILAVILLFVWFFAFTDPSGFLPPGFEQA